MERNDRPNRAYYEVIGTPCLLRRRKQRAVPSHRPAASTTSHDHASAAIPEQAKSGSGSAHRIPDSGKEAAGHGRCRHDESSPAAYLFPATPECKQIPPRKALLSSEVTETALATGRRRRKPRSIKRGSGT